MKKFSKLYDYIDKVCSNLDDEDLKEDFRKCYLSTLETTTRYDEKGNVFVITGDIEAMWLRDSSVQVSHYVRLAGVDDDCRQLIKNILKRQFNYIIEDPYANAFNEMPNGKGHIDDETEKKPIVFERKYEIDSLIYPLWLADKYYKSTDDSSIFDDLFFKTFDIILKTLINEQDYKNNSSYYFRRPRESKDSLDNNGWGSDYAYTGLVRSAFRPSDDRCIFPFLIPSNMFIVATLRKINNDLGENALLDKSKKLITDIENGIEKYGITEHPEFGKIYAYEVDGLGNKLLMDDANVPSLLSLPYLDYCKKDDELYLNTRKYVLSKSNPYYYEGICAKGVGSPHTPKDYIWHISLIIEALTGTKDDARRIFEILRSTTANTGFMHEGFDCNNADNFTRSWFAWANTLFAIFIMDCII